MRYNSPQCYLVASSVGSGAAPLEATPGSTVSQLDLSLVTLGVTASGGVGTPSYSWVLYAPDGTDQTGLLSDDEVADPTFTPTLQSGQWVAVCTVSDTAGAVTKAVQQVVVGSNGYIEIFKYDSDGLTNTAPSAGTLVIGGKTWTIVNADADSGPKVLNGNIAVTCLPGTGIGTSSNTASGAKIALSSLHASLTSMVGKELLICAEFDGYVPGTSDEGFVIGCQAPGAGFGGGASGRGHAGGQGRSTNIRAGRIIGQNEAAVSTKYATLTAASVNSFAVRLSNSGAQVYSSTTPGACNTAAKVSALSPHTDGGGPAGVSHTDRTEIFFLVFKPVVGANGTQCRMTAFYVLVKP